MNAVPSVSESFRAPLCGVLAFGSLIWDRRELTKLEMVGEVACMTPWPVEFARSSRRRNWAPTLVRVRAEVGDRVKARVLVYRNEPGVVRDALAESEDIDLRKFPKNVEACEVPGLAVQPIWYTALCLNIDDLRPECLARLAIASVKPCPQLNGIVYLRRCLELGVRTRLSDDYLAEILRISGKATLLEAENWAVK